MHSYSSLYHSPAAAYYNRRILLLSRSLSDVVIYLALTSAAQFLTKMAINSTTLA